MVKDNNNDEIFVPSNGTKIITPKSKNPILVLDQSGSMQDLKKMPSVGLNLGSSTTKNDKTKDFFGDPLASIFAQHAPGNSNKYKKITNIIMITDGEAPEKKKKRKLK